MQWRPGKKFSPIGLDLGSHSLKAVQLKLGPSGWGVASAVSLPRTTPDVPLTPAEVERLQGVLERRGFVGRDVVVAVPPAMLLTSVLELPARAAGVPIEQIAAAEFGRVHKADAAALTMSTWELPPSARASRATYMLAVGAHSAMLESHVDLVESGHLNVVAIEEPSSAGARGCLHATTPSSELTAVIDLGWSAAALTILKRDTVVYTRKLSEAGLSRLYAAALPLVGGDPAELQHDLWRVGFGPSPQSDADNAEIRDALRSHVASLLSDVSKAFGYATHQYPDAAMERVLLIGGGAAIPAIAERFVETLGVPTSPAGAERSAAPMMPATGLALWREAA